ncbi:MAG: hypothetical protein K2G70_03685 [Turicibacter sp.]|nr:hypothetical protein [Turicibacter sp.]
MSRINRIRIVNLNYNHNAIRIDDECFDLVNENTLLSLRNGGGKSVFIQMITALFVHKGYRHAGDRKFESYFTTNQPTFIMVEWSLDQEAGYVLTGMMVRKNQEVKEEESSPELEMLNFIHEYDSENEYDIKNFPILIQDTKKKSLKGFHVCRQLFESCKQNKQLKFYYYDMYQPARSREYFSKLEEYQIYSKEWESIIKKINLKESGLSELFKDAKDEKGLIEKWFLDAVANKLNQHQNRMKSFETMIKKYIVQYKENEGNFKRKEGILTFQNEIQPVINLEEQLVQHETQILKYREELAELYATLEQLQSETNQEQGELGEQLKELQLECHRLLYEQQSLVIYDLLDQLENLKIEKKMQSQTLAQLQIQEKMTQKKAHIYEVAQRYQTYVKASEDVQRAESALELAKKTEQELFPRLQDLGYSLSLIYEEQLERKTRELDKISWQLKDIEQEQGQVRCKLRLMHRDQQEISKTIGGLEATLKSFDTYEKDLSKKYNETFERNLEGLYLTDWLEEKVENVTVALEETKKKKTTVFSQEIELKERQHKVGRDLEDLKESLGEKNAHVLTSQKYLSKLEEELKIRQTMRSYIAWPEENILNKEGMLEAFYQKRQGVEERLRAYEREIEQLKQEKQQLQSGDVAKLPEELSQRLKEVGIQPIRGIEWLKRNGYTIEANQELIKNNPFLPYSLILSRAQMQRLKELNLEINTSFPIPLLVRESLDVKSSFDNLSGYCQLDSLQFYVWFNEELLDKHRLNQLLLLKDYEIEELMQKHTTKQQSLEHYDDLIGVLKHQLLSEESYQLAKQAISHALEEQAILQQNIFSLQQEKERLNNERGQLEKMLIKLNDKIRDLKIKEEEFIKFLKSYEGYMESRRIYIEAKESQERLINELESLDEHQVNLLQSIDLLKMSKRDTQDAIKQTEESFLNFAAYKEGQIIKKDIEDLLSEYHAIDEQMKGTFKQTKEDLVAANQRFKDAEEALDILIKRYELLDADYQLVMYDRFLEEEVLAELKRLRQQCDEQQRIINEIAVETSSLEKEKEMEYKRLKRDLGETEILEKSQVVPRDFDKLIYANSKQCKHVNQLISDLEKKEAIYMREKSNLVDYQHPMSESFIVNSSYRTYEEKDWQLKRKTLIRDYNAKIESRIKVERQISDEFNRLNRLSLFKDEFFLKPLQRLDQSKYNPYIFIEQYETTSQAFENLMQKLEVDIQTSEQEKNSVIQLLLDYVEEVDRQLTQIDQNSSIPIRGKNVRMLEIDVPKWSDFKNLYQIRMNDFVSSITEHCLNLMNQNENIEEFIGTQITTKELYDKIVGTSNIGIRLFKVEEQREYPITWEQVAKNSGGEGFLSAFVILTSLLSFMRKDETDIFSSFEEGKVLLMDNPFAQTNAAHLLKPLIELAKKNNTQLICLSGLGGDSIYSRFENIYSLSLVPSSFKKGCSYMKSQHIKGEIDQHLVIPSRVYVDHTHQESLLF